MELCLSKESLLCNKEVFCYLCWCTSSCTSGKSKWKAAGKETVDITLGTAQTLKKKTPLLQDGPSLLCLLVSGHKYSRIRGKRSPSYWPHTVYVLWSVTKKALLCREVDLNHFGLEKTFSWHVTDLKEIEESRIDDGETLRGTRITCSY